MVAFADPLHATLAALPFAAAAAIFATRRLGARIAPLEVALWIAWALLAWRHAELALADAGLYVAAFGFALAALRLAALVPALARCRRRGLLAAFAASFAFLLFLWPWSRAGRAPDGDEPYYLLLTQSLVEDGDVDLADEYRDRSWSTFSPATIAPQPGDPVGPNGERWSRHGAFLPLLLAPLFAVGGVAGAELGMVALAAALAAASWAAVRARFPAAPAAGAVVWAILTLAPPLFVYSGRFWVELPAALAVAVALAATSSLARSGGEGRGARVALVAALLALPLLKLRFVVLAVPLALLALHRLGSRRRRLQVGIAAALAGAVVAILLWNFQRFGRPLRVYGLELLDPGATSLAAAGRGLAGLALDVAYGLFTASPIWLLLVPAVVVGWRSRTLPRVELLAVAPYVALVASRREWYGGWSPPFRYGIVLLPVLALALVPLFVRRRGSLGFAVAAGALAAATALVAAVAFLHPAWTFSLADGASRPLAEIASIYPGDLLRFTPSTVRPRFATWIWLAALPLLALVALSRRRTIAAPAAGASGAALALLALAAWIVAAHRVPTRIVEVEDAWVEKQGGVLYPEPWTIDRTRFDGGWVLAGRHVLSFAPVPGGPTCRLRLRAAHYGPVEGGLALDVVAGGLPVASFVPNGSAGEWSRFSTEPFALRAGGRVALRTRRPAGATAGADAAGSFWIVDRLELDWR